MPTRLVILGNGIAGTTAARHARKADPDVEITMVSDESDVPYARTALMYPPMGVLRREHLKLYEDAFWPKNRIGLVRARATAIDARAATRQVMLEGEEPLPFDALILATGSRPRFAGWPGQDLPGVRGFYGLPDLDALEAAIPGLVERGERAVIVGGGLIGVELAEVLHARGVAVTHLVRDLHYWGGILPAEESQLVAQHIRSRGIDLRAETELAEIRGTGRVEAIVATSGETIPCGYVGVGIGVAANVEVLEGSGIETNRGILVDRFQRAGEPRVFAAGDCCEHREPPPGRPPTEPIWYTAREQGAIAGLNAVAHLAGQPLRPYAPGVFFNSAKFFDLEYQVYGRITPDLPSGEKSFFWQGGEHALRFQYADTKERPVVGVTALGVRIRQSVCTRWIENGTPLAEAVAHTGHAEFDPELHRQVGRAVVKAYNAHFPDAKIKRRARRGWRRWMAAS